jgi:PadR family transcriptional regulator, regulatory protein PadR
MADDVLRHLFLGFIRLHILYHAEKEPICGAELMEELGEHGYDVGPGTIYPVLHQMQKAGLIAPKAEVVGGKRRNNFRTTAAGRKLLGEARGKLKELVSEVLDDKDARKQRGSRS